MSLLNTTPLTPPENDDIEVLYLEDDPDLAELYELKLKLDGYHVRVARLDAAPAPPTAGPDPELLFIDIRSRARRGLEVLPSWRADSRFRDVPAVILSDLSREALEDRGMRLGDLDQVVRTPYVVTGLGRGASTRTSGTDNVKTLPRP